MLEEVKWTKDDVDKMDFDWHVKYFLAKPMPREEWQRIFDDALDLRDLGTSMAAAGILKLYVTDTPFNTLQNTIADLSQEDLTEVVNEAIKNLMDLLNGSTGILTFHYLVMGYGFCIYSFFAGFSKIEKIKKNLNQLKRMMEHIHLDDFASMAQEQYGHKYACVNEDWDEDYDSEIPRFAPGLHLFKLSDEEREELSTIHPNVCGQERVTWLDRIMHDASVNSRGREIIERKKGGTTIVTLINKDGRKTYIIITKDEDCLLVDWGDAVVSEFTQGPLAFKTDDELHYYLMSEEYYDKDEYSKDPIAIRATFNDEEHIVFVY